MVGLGGLEPPTSRLSGVRSNHLSYRPDQRSETRNQTVRYTLIYFLTPEPRCPVSESGKNIIKGNEVGGFVQKPEARNQKPESFLSVIGF